MVLFERRKGGGVVGVWELFVGVELLLLFLLGRREVWWVCLFFVVWRKDVLL